MSKERYGQYADIEYYRKQIQRFPRLSPPQRADLVREIRKGNEEAKEQMINSNLRLVVFFALRFDHLGLPLADCIAEGNIGLIEAVERFDPAKGAKFSTYASILIKQHIFKGINKMKFLLHLSEGKKKNIAKLGCVSNELSKELGREASDEEIASRMGITVSEVHELNAVKSHQSLDEPITPEAGAAQLKDFLPDPMSSNPLEILSRKSRHDEIHRLLAELNDKEKFVINARYALDGTEVRTQKSIGDELKLTDVRICQIEREALAKMLKVLEEKNPSTK